MFKDWVITVSFGELILKGRNRQRFVNQAEDQIDRAVRKLPIKKSYSELGMYFLEVDQAYVDQAIKEIQKVFGIVYITPTLRVEKTEEAINQAAYYLMEEKIRTLAGGDKEKKQVSFKVEGKRADKTFPLNSIEIGQVIGGNIHDYFHRPGQDQVDLIVDVHNPDIKVWVDIRDQAYVYLDRYSGLGGLPWGSSGKGLLLLSGGIDSPAAGFQVARRGMELGGVHFHAYPFTSERAKDKAYRLAEKMSEYVGPMKLFMVNLAKTYTAINQHCKNKNTTLLSRRMMMRISDQISDQYGYDALITGESLGQVASQTIQGIHVVNEAAFRPILRPFIATDKTDIVDIARKIDTYDISIEPYEDSCSIFAPSSPNTKPSLGEILREEENLPIEDLLEEAMESLEIIDID